MPGLKASETNAEAVHGSTQIKPGDKVGYQGRMQRVIEVDEENGKLTIHRTSGMHSSVETIRAEAVTDYEPRE